MSLFRRTSTGKVRYPLATILFYGPNDQRASKAVAAVFYGKDKKGPLRRWHSENGDVREDQQTTEEITLFLKEHGVVESVITERIIGCPHEEGVDYPLGVVCPTCSFWWNIDRWTHRPLAGEHEPGRNDPCPCGSGKKYKKCCGGA